MDHPADILNTVLLAGINNEDQFKMWKFSGGDESSTTKGIVLEIRGYAPNTNDRASLVLGLSESVVRQLEDARYGFVVTFLGGAKVGIPIIAGELDLLREDPPRQDKIGRATRVYVKSGGWHFELVDPETA